jgi:uncharacterized membrane protein
MRTGRAVWAAAAALVCSLGACTGAGGERGTDSTAARAPATVTDTAVRADTPAGSGTAVRTFHVVGNEPFWSLEITASVLRFRTPEDTAGVLFPQGGRSVAGDTLIWSGSAGNRTIEARLWPAECSDGMSDRVWTYRAIVRVDTVSYRGCAAQT